MLVVRTLAALRQARADLGIGPGKTLALVPTMGALHAGHISLVRAARDAGHVVAASIFVNPTQFGPNEDFSRYPRALKADCEILAAAGCAFVWVPEVATMYPPGDSTTVDVAGPSARWEGEARPGHFRGVATVVTKLFGQVRPDIAYFGEKDWQQVQVIRRLVADLFLPVEIAVGPTLREDGGLAMSSRNRYLDPAGRARAAAIHVTLRDTRDALRSGTAVAETLAAGTAALARAGFAVDYLVLVDGETLEPLETLVPGARLLVAVRLGTTRLLDTVPA